MNPRKGSTSSFTRAVNNSNGKLKNSFLTNYPHHTVPGYNLNIHSNIDNYDDDNIAQLFKPFPYDSNLPRPLLPPAKLPQCVLQNDDPALRLLSIKSEIKDDIDRITNYHEKYRRDLTVCHKKNIRWNRNDKKTAQTSLPRYVAELAEIIDSDPDPEFEGKYNWYYTRGSLNHFNFSGRNILLFPYAEELVVAPIIEQRKSSWKLNLEKAGKCDLESTLYETRCAVTSGGTCKILGRQKFTCNIYSLSEDRDKLDLDHIEMRSSDLPYVSADLSSIILNQYCTAKSNRLIEILDLNKTKCVNSFSMPRSTNLPDNWMSLKFDESDANLVAIVDRCCVHQIDLRTPFEGPNLTLCPKSNLEICECLSLNATSKYNPFYHYLGTYHSLLLCDSRFGKSSVVQKWTHQFKSPPMFCGIVERSHEEIVALSSQLSGENSVILNTWTSDTEMHSYNLPYMPSTISETLRACQDKGKCLDPSMRSRLELCTAGTALNLNENNEVTFFIQNSIGDVFYQCITHEKMLQNISEINTRSLLALDAWEEAYLKQSKTVKPLVVSEKVNMKHVLSAMTNVNRSLEIKESDKESVQPKWFQSTEELSSYIDILAPELLSVWDIGRDTVPLAVTPHQKVLSWLEKKTLSQNLTQSQEDSSLFDENREISSQELISVSQNIQPDNNSIQQIVHDVPASQTKPKKVVKKKKYIAGF